MSRYRVTLTRTSVEIVTADNPYQAAIVAAQGHDDVEVAEVRPAVGRTPGTTRVAAPKTAKKTVKKVVKKRRPMSPEARAKLAQNLVEGAGCSGKELEGCEEDVG